METQYHLGVFGTSSHDDQIYELIACFSKHNPISVARAATRQSQHLVEKCGEMKINGEVCSTTENSM